MLKPADLRAMTPFQRTQLFETMATTFYETESNAPKLAADFDVSRPTIFRWRKEHNVPFAVLYTLDHWLNGQEQAERIVADWKDMPAQLSEAADKLATVARTMARVARLSTAGAGPSPS